MKQFLFNLDCSEKGTFRLSFASPPPTFRKAFYREKKNGRKIDKDVSGTLGKLKMP